MDADLRPAVALLPVAAVVLLPALLPPVDLTLADHEFPGERLVYLTATAMLGLWAARGRPLVADAVALAAMCCLWFLVLPRGLQWPSYSYPDFALCAAVAWALWRLAADEPRQIFRFLAVLALTLWIADSLIMAPWCGWMIDWEFTGSTACGSLLGDRKASIPSALALAGWLWWIRQARHGV